MVKVVDLFTYETRRGGPSAFDPKRTISPFTKAKESLMRSNFINNLRNLKQENIDRALRNFRRLNQEPITRYKQDVRETKYKYKRVLEEFHNRNKPSLSEYEKEYIRLWNLSGSVRKNIITDVEKEALENLDLFTHFCTPKLKIEIVRECCNRVIIPIMKNTRIKHKRKNKYRF